MTIPMHSLAQLYNPVLPKKIGGGPTPSVSSGGIATGALITQLVDGIFVFAFIMALFFLLIGALHWITSGGDKANLENARNKITHAIIGLIIIAAAWAVMILVGNFFGIDFTNIPIPSFGGSSSVQTGGLTPLRN